MTGKAQEQEFYHYDNNKRVIARKYEKVRLILDVVNGTVLPVLTSLFLVLSRISPELGKYLQSLTGSYWLSVALYVVVFVFFLQLLATPFTFYSGFVVEHRFGLSVQRAKDWMTDDLKSIALEAVFGVLLGIVVYYLMQLTYLWWLLTAFFFAALEILLSTVLPYVIMPIFYKVTPLADTRMKDHLIDMAKRVGTKDIQRVLVADESRRSIRANAMFSGIGSSRAIVLFDTLIKNFPSREVVTVVAHELGHYVNKDIWKSAAISGILTVLPLFLADYVLRNSATALGLAGITDPAGIPIIFGVLLGFGFVLQPISNGFSRILERQADEFSLRAAEDPDAQASAERRLADLDLSVDTPNRFIELFFYTHPSSSKRVAMAEDWKKNRRPPTNR